MKPCFVSPLIQTVGRELGIEVRLEPKYGYAGQLILPNGQKRYFRNNSFDINLLGASEIAKDKMYAASFLAKMNYPVPEGEEFFSDAWCETIASKREARAAYRYAQSIGFPVIIKPNNKSQGEGVFKVAGKIDFFRSVETITASDRVFLVQRIVEGDDFRFVVLDQEVLAVYQRIPLSVTGDGQSSILTLLKQKQKSFDRLKRFIRISFADNRITNQLKQLKLTLDSILGMGQIIQVLPIANLSLGGEAIDLSEKIHPDWKRLAIEITRAMGLRFCGLDFIIQGKIWAQPFSYVILELNPSPGLEHFASLGKKQRERVKIIYRKLLETFLEN